MKMTLREETLVKFDSFIFQMTLRMYTYNLKGENIQIVKRESQRLSPVIFYACRSKEPLVSYACFEQFQLAFSCNN
jgi:transcription initiation factor IIE alpha subunit